MPMYRFADPEWDDRLWYGMVFGRELVPTPGPPAVTPIEPKAVRVGGISHFESGISRFQAGWFGSDVVDTVKDVASSAATAVTKTLDQIPGIDQLGNLAKDFANTAVGKIVLTAMASGAYQSLTPLLGNQLASIAFALPGVVQGQPFDQAYWAELRMRIEKTAEIAGPAVAEAAAAQLQPITDYITKTVPIKDIPSSVLASGKSLAGLPPTTTYADLMNKGIVNANKLADTLKFRQDMVQSARDLLNRANSFGRGELKMPPLWPAFPNGLSYPALPGKAFDPATGKETDPSFAAPMPVPAKALLDSAAQGHPAAHYTIATIHAHAVAGNPRAQAAQAALARAAKVQNREKWVNYYGKMAARATAGFTSGYCTAGCSCKG